MGTAKPLVAWHAVARTTGTCDSEMNMCALGLRALGPLVD